MFEVTYLNMKRDGISLNVQGLECRILRGLALLILEMETTNSPQTLVLTYKCPRR